jgi:DNA-binding transcriptional ArsR family regulator
MQQHPSCSPNDHLSARKLPKVDLAVLERAAAIFGALGDPGRLRILAMIAERERCVTELAVELDENVSTVSQRLKLLRGERLARSRRSGKHIYYSPADQHIVELVANAFDHAMEPMRSPAVAKKAAKSKK